MSLREHLKADLKRAMKVRESQTVTTLRSMLAAIDNAEAVNLDISHVPVVGQANDVPRKALSEAQQRDILKGEAEELRLAIGEYERLDRPEEVEDLYRALGLVSEYAGEIATPVKNDVYYVLRFQAGDETDAFVRALQRFLDSPRGGAYIEEPQSAEVWAARDLTDDPLEVYLSGSALAATEEAFAPVPVQDIRSGNNLPTSAVLLLRGATLNPQ